MSSSSNSGRFHSAVQTEIGFSFRFLAKKKTVPLLTLAATNTSSATFVEDSDKEESNLDDELLFGGDDNNNNSNNSNIDLFYNSSAIIKLIEDIPNRMDTTTTTTTTNTTSTMIMGLAPRTLAIVCMTLAMALHFGGYEFARSSSLSLFTSHETGFASPSAFPLAMAMVSPFSVLLLMAYSTVLEHGGPRLALRQSTLGSILVLFSSGILLHFLQSSSSSSSFPLVTYLFCKALVGLVFVFQNSYAHLLYAQQWSFLGSVMTPAEGARYFATIAGVSSLATTCTGALVSWLVERVGLLGLLLCTCVTLSGSAFLSEQSYRLAQDYGFDPAKDITQKQKSKQQERQEEESRGGRNRFQEAAELFRREPRLGGLAAEMLSFQSLSTILNVCFVAKLKSTIVDDVARAAWTGKFYASINAVSGAFQFLLLPVFFKAIEPSVAWRIMPLIPVVCSVFQSFQMDPSLYLLAFSFFAAKTMDYSVRGVVNEMVYVPLDFESRYLGKEIIGVFGSRFGKSGMSLLLSALTYAFGNFGVRQMSFLSSGASLLWLSSAWYLSGLVPKTEEAEKVVDERRKQTRQQQSLSSHQQTQQQQQPRMGPPVETTKPKES